MRKASHCYCNAVQIESTLRSCASENARIAFVAPVKFCLTLIDLRTRKAPWSVFQDGTGVYRSTYMQHFLPMLTVLTCRTEKHAL